MDLLEDILKQSGLKTRVLGHRSFRSEVALQFPCSKSIGFHAVTHGTAYLHSGKKVISLNKGDLVLMARGRDHVVSTEMKLNSMVIPLAEFSSVEISPSAKSKLTLVSGAYQLWNDPVHPFFAEIPEWFVMKSEDIESFDSLQSMIKLLAQEVAKPGLGAQRVIQGILDIMFSLIIRKVVEKNSARPETWSHAVQDFQIKQALEFLHADRARAWTLQDLAHEVGLSRAGFALKFKKAMGDTPLHYLTMIRIQKAMELLSNTDLNVEGVAAEVGYQDAFSFSKAFKKITGVPPREFRTKDHEDKKNVWRF